MKIIFVHDHVLKKYKNDYYTSGGIGDENIHQKYCDNSNDELYLYTRYVKSDKIYSLIKFSDKKVHCIPSLNYHSPIDYFLKYKKIKKEINIDEYDAFILRVPSLLSLVIYKKLKNKKKYYVEVVGCPWDALRYRSILGKILAPFLYFKTKEIIKNSSYTQYVTNEFLQKRYPSHNSIGCSDVVIKTDETVLKKRLISIKEKDYSKKVVVSTIGNVDISYKGQQYVIRAISMLKKKGYNIEYQLIGGGTGKNLKKLSMKLGISNNLKFIGQIEHSEVIKKLKNEIDIYIQPSNVEGLCRSLIEAMGCALPCIASNVGGNPELIDDKYLFPKKNVKQIYKLLLLFIESIDEQEKAIVSNFDKAKQFDCELLTNKRNNFYFSFLNNIKNEGEKDICQKK